MALEKIALDGSETGLTAGEKINAIVDNFVLDDITKTVGAGKDFTTFHEAMEWVKTVDSKALIVLSLDDGNHIMGDGLTYPNGGFTPIYEIYKTSLRIQSASGTKENCIITMPNVSNAGYIGGFRFINSHFYFAQVTIDCSVNGYVGSSSMIIIESKASVDCVIWECDIKNYRWISIQSGRVSIDGTTFDSASYTAILAYYHSLIVINFSSSIINSATGIGYQGGIVVAVDCTMTNNTIDYSIPLNEIQYNGGYITTNDTALSFKA